MTKKIINTLIRNLQQTGMVTKTTPWLLEGKGNKELNVRYVGVKPTGDWLEIMSATNNLLLKFSFDKQTSMVEYFLANQPPFIRLSGSSITPSSKWELLLGELKRQLKKDKEAVLHHTDSIDNLYKKIEPHLK